MILSYSIPGVTDCDIMGEQCLRWRQGRHNSTMSLPNQIYAMASTSSTVHVSSKLAAKRNWSVETKRSKAVTWEGAAKSNYGQTEIVEERWRQFFSDPSQWWDHRSGKTNVKFPDFKHKETDEALWINDQLNPDWVEAQLATLAPGMVNQPLSYWNREIERNVKDKNYKVALDLFEQMQREGVQADKYTLKAVLRSCARTRDLDKGRDAHRQVTQNGFEGDPFIGTSLFDMYVKCGRVEDAYKVFKGMPRTDVSLWTSMIVAYVRSGQGKQGLELYREMESANVAPVSKTYVAVLNACNNIGALEEGKRVHAQIMQSGCESDIFVGNSLVDMYTKSGSIDDAQRVFDKMNTRNVTVWNAMIGAYVRCGQAQKALELYKQMKKDGTGFIPGTFMLLLKACANLGALDEGRHVHSHITRSGCESNVFLARSLVDMYAKCGSIEDAEKVFGTMPEWNAISWTAMIGGYVKCGQGAKALELYQQMQDRKVTPAPATFVGVLNACASIPALKVGREVHAQIIERGCETDMFVHTSLIDMYSKCGSVLEARAVFDKILTRNVVSWSAMILAYVKSGEGKKAFTLYQQMLKEGLKPFPSTFLAVLNACASLGSLEDGRRVHSQIIQNGFESDLYVSCSLIDMYAKCGSIQDAEKIFRKMRAHSVVSWNTMIRGYVRCGQEQKALDLYGQMEAKGLEPVSATYVGLLTACGNAEALEIGRHIHEQIIQKNYDSDLFVGSSLMEMYSKCDSIDDARAVFDALNTKNVVCWNTMVSGYVQCGQGEKALQIFKRMESAGVDLNHNSYIAGLNACASVGALEEGRRAHSRILERGYELDDNLASSLLNMYLKCGSVEDADRVFNKMQAPSVSSWDDMIMAHLQDVDGQKALHLYSQMLAERVEPLPSTFVALLKTCALVGALGEGRRIHAHIIESGYESDAVVGHALLDMYAKCGSMDDARKLFNNMWARNLNCWNVMLEGYAMHGLVQEAGQLFETMCKERVEVDVVTFTFLLLACRHGPLVKEGLHYFKSMPSDHGISPRKEHYACIADLLGRSGHLQEAEDMINSMQGEPDVTVWLALLESCTAHGNFELGEKIADGIVAMGPASASGYDVLETFYAAAGRSDCREHVNEVRMERNGKEEDSECTLIELNDKVHSFAVDEKDHPQLEEIYLALRRLYQSMEQAGFVPDARFVLQDKDQGEMVSPLSHHSEMLAIGLGLISSTPGTPLRIVNNVKVAGDCHSAIKFISRVSGRTIIARYGNRFHRFKNGLCSCRDYYW
ncbi:unnamed protein product [Calypogeia fissa]